MLLGGGSNSYCGLRESTGTQTWDLGKLDLGPRWLYPMTSKDPFSFKIFIILLLGRLGQEDGKFETSLGNLARACLKIKRSGNVAQ